MMQKSIFPVSHSSIIDGVLGLRTCRLISYFLIEDETEEARSERLKIKAEKEKEQNKKAGKALAAKAATLGPELKSGLSNRSAASLLDLRPTKQFAFVQSGRRGPSQVRRMMYPSSFVSTRFDHANTVSDCYLYIPVCEQGLRYH
jgi:hypothetical protein